jgi:hypothetical protein
MHKLFFIIFKMSSQSFLKKFKAKPLTESTTNAILLTDLIPSEGNKISSERKKLINIKKEETNSFFEVVPSTEEKKLEKSIKKRRIDYTESVFSKEDLHFEVKINKSFQHNNTTEENIVPIKEKQIPYSSLHGRQTRWDLESWIDEAIPLSIIDFQCFVEQNVNQMEGGDRGNVSKPEENTNKVLKSIEETIKNWKHGKRKIHCLIGAPSTGKTLMLKLLAKKYDLEWNPVHEDNPPDLKFLLANAGNQSLDSKEQLWVIEHFDFFDKQCKQILKSSFSKLLKSGPVFITLHPVTDLRPFQQYTISSCLSWPLSAKILFLEKYGPSNINWEDLYAEGNGEIPRILSYGQYHRNISSHSFENICGNETCKGFCSICTRKRRIPHNLRLLVEDTLCPRTSPIKEKMLGETDADLSIMLLQEMIPYTDCSLDSLRRCYDAISLLDCCTEYSTFVKDAFLNGLLQKQCRTENMKFSSKNNFAFPEMLFGKNRRTLQGDSKKEILIAKYRGCKHYIPRKRCTFTSNNDDGDDEEGYSKSKGLIEESEQKYEYNLGDAQVDVRDLFEDISLFQQASNI